MTERSGYSVFEVLIAFTIMSMVLAALLPGQAKLLARAYENEARILAFDLAQSTLARLDELGEVTIGQTSFQNGQFRVTQGVLPSASRTDSLQILDVTIAVEDVDGRVLAQIAVERSSTR